jgi:superfamily II DNA or RNA helicase
MQTLRQYQQAARVQVLCDWTEIDATMVVMATGLGKTVLFASLARDWTAAGRGRSLVMVPDIKLVGQAAKKIRQWTGDRPAIEQGSKWANEAEWARSKFVVASAPSLLSQDRYKRFEEVGLVIVDECDDGMTQKRQDILRWYIDRGAKVLGVTASPKRSDGIAMANMFDRCSFNYSIADAIRDGWLAPPMVSCLQLESLDLSHVKLTSTGDFNQEQLNTLMETDKVVFEIASAVAQESVGLKTVVYCGRVKGAKAISDYLRDRYSIESEWVCGDANLCDPQRFSTICESFTQEPDGIQVICNVGKLTRGWDYPGLQHIVNARPTMSLPLLTQIFGRGTRALEGVVDFEGSTPETRRAAIANSAKPHFKFTDLRDAVMRHKLVGPVDVLAGSIGLPYSDRAKGKLGGQPTDLMEAIAEAKREQELEEQRRIRRARAQIETSAKFRRVEVDPFDEQAMADEVKERGSSRRHPFDPATAKQLNYLRFLGLNTYGCEVSKKQAMRMISQFKRGESLEQVRKTNRLRRVSAATKPTRSPDQVDDVNRLLLER